MLKYATKKLSCLVIHSIKVMNNNVISLKFKKKKKEKKKKKLMTNLNLCHTCRRTKI